MAFRVLIFSILLIQLRVSSAFQCFFCDSSEDENCATLRGNTTDFDCPGDCAVWIAGKDTFRGCSEDVPEIAIFQNCSSNGCNRLIFPVDRMKCNVCSASDDSCATPSADLLYSCKNFVQNDECYTHVINETSAIRGCMSDEDENVNLCNSVGESCFKCSEDACNMENGINYISCITCSSDEDKSCGYTKEQGTSQEKLCDALLGRENLCFSYVDETLVIRGCLNDHPELKSKCENNSAECQICDEDSCNNLKMIEEFCSVCDSRTDPDCDTVLQTQTPTLCGEGSINNSGCYLSDKGGVVQRGCLTALSEPELGECRDGETCKICEGHMCNSKPKFQKCTKCSSETNPDCATLQGPLPEKICDDYLDTCTMFAKPNMTTHRGCSKEIYRDEGVECAALSINCRQCSDNNCNGEIFPTNRLTCFHCEGASDSECYKSLENNSALSYPCKTYNFRDSCYFHLDNENAIHRGCMTDLTNATEVENCLNKNEKCKTCQTSNCNAESVMKPANLSCITCDTTMGEDCNWGWSMSSAGKCMKERFFYENESCYTLTVSDQTIRGCTLDGNVCRVSPRCALCQDESCNRANTAVQTCYECNTDDDPDCAAKPYHTKNVTCPGVIQYDYRGCFTWVDEMDKVVRGCFSDLSAEERNNCITDDENCEICEDAQTCNDEPKNSGGFVAGNIILTLVMMFLLSFGQ